MIRERYIAAGLITPALPKPNPLTAPEMDALGYHAAAAAKRAYLRKNHAS